MHYLHDLLQSTEPSHSPHTVEEHEPNNNTTTCALPLDFSLKSIGRPSAVPPPSTLIDSPLERHKLLSAFLRPTGGNQSAFEPGAMAFASNPFFAQLLSATGLQQANCLLQMAGAGLAAPTFNKADDANTNNNNNVQHMKPANIRPFKAYNPTDPMSALQVTGHMTESATRQAMAQHPQQANPGFPSDALLNQYKHLLTQAQNNLLAKRNNAAAVLMCNTPSPPQVR
jgi:hypothetical protein